MEKGIVFDIYGTVVLTDCVAENYYRVRRGLRKALARAKKEKLRIAFFGDDDARTIDFVLKKAKLLGYDTKYGNQLDDEGLKNLTLFPFKFVYIGDMPRDLRAALKYRIPFIKVPPFVVKNDRFDLYACYRIALQLLANETAKLCAQLRKEGKYFFGRNFRLRFEDNVPIIEFY